MAALTIEQLDSAVQNFYEGHGGPEVSSHTVFYLIFTKSERL